MKPLYKILLTILLVVCAGLFSIQFIQSIVYVVKNITHYFWFLGGGVLYYLVMCVFFKKNLQFTQTWIHEFLHTVACIVMGRRMESFHATANNGGLVEHYGGYNIFISLTPYTIPFFTIILLALRLIIPMRFGWFTIFIGFSFFMHLHTFIVQTRPYQPDLKVHGLFLSYAYIATILPMLLGICLYSVDLNLWYGIQYFFSQSWILISTIVGG